MAESSFCQVGSKNTDMKKASTQVDWDKVAEITGLKRLSEPPPNSFTAEEYAEKYGLSYTQAGKRLKSSVDAGKLTRVQVKKPSWTHAIYYYY